MEGPAEGKLNFNEWYFIYLVNGYKNGVTNDNWITLNVGGKYFTTTKTTLKKDPKSFLARLASIDKNDVDQLNDLGSEKDETGAFLIGNLMNSKQRLFYLKAFLAYIIKQFSIFQLETPILRSFLHIFRIRSELSEDE